MSTYYLTQAQARTNILLSDRDKAVNTSTGERLPWSCALFPSQERMGTDCVWSVCLNGSQTEVSCNCQHTAGEEGGYQ